ncbi:MAG: MoxR family ATPase [Verrucomicrobiota bacterium]|nr:MoxR family ATPase [Verrucomicrobiota bacterium]
MQTSPSLNDEVASRRQAITTQMAKAIVGQEWVIENLLLTLFCGGHALILGVPGLAKTRMIRSLSQILDLSFNRIQFTPDLMPSDITGTDIIEEDHETSKRRLAFLPGPLFANLVLADEINRTPPKTQAAMLQAMQEMEVSIGNKTYELPRPFHIFATQNPIEMEGTYELPEAQADRFMFCIRATYPTPEEEHRIVRQTTGNEEVALTPVLNAEELSHIQRIVRAVPVSDEVIDYAVRLVGASRPDHDMAGADVKEFVRWGASPRASQYLVLGAKGYAAITGQPCADYEGVRYVAQQVLGHRILMNFNARAQKITSENIINGILKTVKTSSGKVLITAK